MGGIGQRMGERSRAFGMSIIYRNRSPLPAHLEQGARFVECVSQLCAESDFLLLSCPSTEATRRIVDRDLLARARPSLILVNIGRGDLVDDDALIEALADGRSEEHTSELQSLMRISYAVFCLKKKTD